MRRRGVTSLLILVWLSSPGLAWPQPEAGAIRLENLTPAEGTEGNAPQVPITAIFAGGRGGVNLGSVRIFLDDQEVTGQSVITPQFFSFRPLSPLSAGLHRVRVALVDRGGTGATQTWTFVVGRRTAYIDRVIHNAADRPLGVGEALQVTVTGTPGAQVEVWVVSAGQPAAALTARETSSGVYVAMLPVKAEDPPGEGAVLARLTNGGARAYQAASQPVEFAGSPHTLQPKVLNLRQGERIGTSIPIQGQTHPRATVHIRARADSSLFGTLAVRQDLADDQVLADAGGRFRAEVGTASLVPGSRVRIELTATSADGQQTSAPTVLSVVRE